MQTLAPSQALHSVQRAEALIDAGMALLQAWRPEVAASVRLLLHTVLVIDTDLGSCGGASNPMLLGMAWLRPGGRWGPEQVAESLLHEAVHQALFIDDAVEGIFSDAAIDSAPEVLSAVRTVYPSSQEPIRTFWAAYHAACVAMWLARWSAHRALPLQQPLQDALRRAIPPLQQHRHLLLPRGQALLGMA